WLREILPQETIMLVGPAGSAPRPQPKSAPKPPAAPPRAAPKAPAAPHANAAPHGPVNRPQPQLQGKTLFHASRDTFEPHAGAKPMPSGDEPRKSLPAKGKDVVRDGSVTVGVQSQGSASAASAQASAQGKKGPVRYQGSARVDVGQV